MRIAVNNGGFTEIERTKWGISVARCDSKGYVEGRENFDDGEIVMALNLLQQMRDNDIKSALVPCGNEEEMHRFLSNLLHNGDLLEFRIFQ